MLKRIREATQDDRGFTLIELMVVVLIIAILIAIAIPTFLGLRQRAQDRSVQSDLRNGLTAAKAFYTDANTYTGFGVPQGEAIEPPLNWSAALAGTCPATGCQVHIAQANVAELTLNTRSLSGNTFCIADLATGATARTVRGTGTATDFADCANNTPVW